MACEPVALLHGYLDGELDAAGSAAFERHLAACADCQATLRSQRALRESIRAAGLRERAPEGLRRKVEAKIVVPARKSVSPAWRWVALAATVLLAIAVAWRQVPTSGAETRVAAVVDAHLRSLQPGHLVDVLSTDQHTVKPWFDGRVDFAPPVRDFAEQGFPLKGGRLDVVEGTTVAVVVYGRRKHEINVFVWPTDGDSTSSSGTRLGYHWTRWSKDGMEMLAVSDVSAGDLAELRRVWME